MIRNHSKTPAARGLAMLRRFYDRIYGRLDKRVGCRLPRPPFATFVRSLALTGMDFYLAHERRRWGRKLKPLRLKRGADDG